MGLSICGECDCLSAVARKMSHAFEETLLNRNSPPATCAYTKYFAAHARPTPKAGMHACRLEEINEREVLLVARPSGGRSHGYVIAIDFARHGFGRSRMLRLAGPKPKSVVKRPRGQQRCRGAGYSMARMAGLPKAPAGSRGGRALMSLAPPWDVGCYASYLLALRPPRRVKLPRISTRPAVAGFIVRQLCFAICNGYPVAAPIEAPTSRMNECVGWAVGSRSPKCSADITVMPRRCPQRGHVTPQRCPKCYAVHMPRKRRPRKGPQPCESTGWPTP